MIDKKEIFNSIDRLLEIKKQTKADILFSIKSLAEVNTLKTIGESVDGFSVSSLNEARLVHDEARITRDRISIVSPGLNEKDIRDISYYAGTIVYNSIEQALRLHPLITRPYVAGIRVNTGVSSVSEARYDPCKLNSKLGVPIKQLKARWKELGFVQLIHFHTNCEGTDLKDLEANVDAVSVELSDFLHNVLYVNIGGGYFFHDIEDFSRMKILLGMFNASGVKVIMEPGGTVVKRAGTMIASVTDIFENNGTSIAIVDTSVNHLPEVLEYNFKLDVAESNPKGQHKFILAGPTCLSGDDFGEYWFDKPLEIGDRVTFKDVGCYSMVKAHTFNGVNLPNIYTKNISGKLSLIKQAGYEDYRSRWV